MRTDIEQLVLDLRIYAIPVILRIQPRKKPLSPSVFHELDAFVAEFGWQGLGDGWREIRRTPARLLIQHLLRYELTHKSEVMTARQAARFAHRFLDFIQKPGRCFTNAELRTAQDTGLTPYQWPLFQDVSGHTFGVGVLWIDQTQIGMLWIAEDD